MEIAAPPMNLLGPELVRDLVSLIGQAEAGDAIRVLVFKSARSIGGLIVVPRLKFRYKGNFKRSKT